jgi:hypothetical protein
VLAAGGWILSGDDSFAAGQAIAVSAALGAFFLANLAVIRAATDRLLAFEDELRQVAPELPLRSSMLRRNLAGIAMPGRMPLSYLLHFAVDAAVIFAVWSKTAA